MDQVLIGTFLFCAYFLPSIVASSRKHGNGLAIFMLNLLLGWMVLPWLIALIWSCTSHKRPVKAIAMCDCADCRRLGNRIAI